MASSSECERIENLIRSGDNADALKELERILDSPDGDCGAIGIWSWAYRKRAQCLFAMNKFTDAGRAASRALETAEEADDDGERARALNVLGIIHAHLSDYEKAIEYLEASYEIQHRLGLPSIGAILNNLGEMRMQTNSPEDALPYFERAVESAQERDDRELAALATGNIGRAYEKQGKPDEAIRAHLESIRLYEETDDHTHRLHQKVKLGNSLESANRPGEAERLYRECVAEAEQRSDFPWPDMIYGSLGRLLGHLEKTAEAQKWLERAIEAVGDNPYNERLPDLRTHLSRVLEQAGDLTKALEQQRLAFEDTNRIHERKIRTRLFESFARFDLKRVEQEKEAIRKQNRELERALGEVRTLRDRLELRNAELAELATRDPLTGAFNRRRFLSVLEAEIRRTHRYGHELSLAMLDLDGFKAINDYYGHTVGDRVLVDVTGIVMRRIRSTDTFARHGGEEFAIVMPETALDAAAALCEELRHAVAHHIWDYLSGDRPVTVSVGVGALCFEESGDAFVQRIDTTLYNAKRWGRNRVAIAEEHHSSNER